MNTELAICPLAGGTAFILLEDGKPAEIQIDDGTSAVRRQDILVGKVSRVVPALGCVFVDIGTDHDAMLPISEASAAVKSGQTLIVQVTRLAAPGKGHKITTRISLPGPFAVYRPQGSPNRRSRLAMFDLARQSVLYSQDLERLQKSWRQAEDAAGRGEVPRCLLTLGDPLYHALISLTMPDLTRIIIEGDELFSRVYSLVQAIMPDCLPLLNLHIPQAGYGLAAVLGVSSLPDDLRRRKVWLDSGGFLVIDQTEALTVIDVNSGKDTRGGESSELRLRTNIQAAAEVARQIRLRNTGGGIIIDFINLADDEDRAAVTQSLTQALARDRAAARVLGFTALGLLEMTRTPV